MTTRSSRPCRRVLPLGYEQRRRTRGRTTTSPSPTRSRSRTRSKVISRSHSEPRTRTPASLERCATGRRDGRAPTRRAHRHRFGEGRAIAPRGLRRRARSCAHLRSSELGPLRADRSAKLPRRSRDRSGNSGAAPRRARSHAQDTRDEHIPRRHLVCGSQKVVGPSPQCRPRLLHRILRRREGGGARVRSGRSGAPRHPREAQFSTRSSERSVTVVAAS